MATRVSIKFDGSEEAGYKESIFLDSIKYIRIYEINSGSFELRMYYSETDDYLVYNTYATLAEAQSAMDTILAL